MYEDSWASVPLFEELLYMELDGFPGCCGILVASDFSSLSNAESEEERAAMIAEFTDKIPERQNLLYLVALTDDQLKEGWNSVVRKAGFRRLIRFRNKNTNNICNLFGFAREDVPAYSHPRKKKQPKMFGR